MVRWAAAGIVLVSALAMLAAAPQPPAVRVWAASLQLPTSVEGPANPNPPFDVFTFGRFNYPYPIRDALTDRRETVTWRTLHLENEYLRLTVLPDLGGHIYSSVDKRTGREMFYANTAIKKALIGYRGAWAAFGVEFNFPVSHNWMSMSPVDFAAVPHPDGSGSIWVGNTDQVYGTRWRVELTLQPGRAVLEQKVDLYNPSDVRQRYYWWSNAAVQVWDDSRLVYPTELMGTHGFTRIEPWPIDRQGRDMSVIRNQTDGPVSLFTYRTREPFVGVYHPRTNSGTVHVASPAELPVHKVWSWGADRDAATWRTALSDDDSAYVELQAGLFRNQETYAFLEPQESVRFTENWLPVRDLGGLTRANVDAVLHMEREGGRLQLALDTTREVPGARILLTHAGATLIDSTVSLSPREVWRAAVTVPNADLAVLRVTDATGTEVIAHREKTFDLTPASEVRLGPTVVEGVSPSAPRSVTELVDTGQIDELEGRRLTAMATYRSALEQYAGNFQLLKAAGRLAVALGWPEAGRDAHALTWLEAAHARHTTDFEVQYYLGLALAASGRAAEARTHLESAQRFHALRAAASVQLARLSARQGNLPAALAHIRVAAAAAPRATAIGGTELSLLRQLGRTSEARERATHWLAVDPASSLLRYESSLLGEADERLWAHLAADVNRILDLVDHYLAIGAHPDALRLLDRPYPHVDPPAREPGSVSPHESPLVPYYRAHLRRQAGGSPERDYREARALATTYVFPNRRSSYNVLRAAVGANTDDAAARFLLGSLYLAGGLVDTAIAEWQQVRRTGAQIPTLHRNLALALLHPPSRLRRFGEASPPSRLRRFGEASPPSRVRRVGEAGAPDVNEARRVLEEGAGADPQNVEVYVTLDGVLSAVDAAPGERVTAIRRFPAPDRMPSSMVFKLALALAESGDDAGADRLFHGRFFPREEGGTNVRAVYAQVRVTSARIAARGGRCPAALDVLAALPREQKALPFTAGGLADAVASPQMEGQIAAIESACGQTRQARARWERLARPLATGGAPMSVAIADEARTRLGRTRTADQRRRLEQALEATTRTLDSAGTSNPGLVELARASLLAALDRDDESRRSREKVFLYPDRNLSHALARAWLPAAEARR